MDDNSGNQDNEWDVIHEEYVIVNPRCSNESKRTIEKQNLILKELFDSFDTRLISNPDTSKLSLEIETMALETKPDDLSINSTLLFETSEENDQVEYKGQIRSKCVFDKSQIQFKNLRLNRLEKLGIESELNLRADDRGIVKGGRIGAEDLSDSDFEDFHSLKIGMKKIKKKRKRRGKRSRNVRNAIEEFTNSCIKDLKKKIKYKAMEKRQRKAKLRLLLGKERPTVKKITVKEMKTSNF